jgi:hypothetical protein
MLAGRFVVGIAFAITMFAASLRAPSPSPLPDDATGKLTQETQLGADDPIRNKIEVAPSRSPSPAKRK